MSRFLTLMVTAGRIRWIVPETSCSAAGSGEHGRGVAKVPRSRRHGTILPIASDGAPLASQRWGTRSGRKPSSRSTARSGISPMLSSPSRSAATSFTTARGASCGPRRTLTTAVNSASANSASDRAARIGDPSGVQAGPAVGGSHGASHESPRHPRLIGAVGESTPFRYASVPACWHSGLRTD